jgi:hypothetical protein
VLDIARYFHFRGISNKAGFGTHGKPLFALPCFTPNLGSKLAGSLIGTSLAIPLFPKVFRDLPLLKSTKKHPVFDAKKV